MIMKNMVYSILKLLLFWILFFDAGRILFSIHNAGKFTTVSFGEWLLAFVYSLRIDLASAAAFSAIPLLILVLSYIWPGKWSKAIFYTFLSLEILFVALIHCGEINAYTEWNHKLTTRVFLHLSNPDEVFRTAGFSMFLWFFFYLLLEIIIAFFLVRFLFLEFKLNTYLGWQRRILSGVLVLFGFLAQFFLLIRGGIQQIPLNIASAYYSNNHVLNDLSVNSIYYFTQSYLLHNRASIDEFMPDIKQKEAESIVKQLYNYPKTHTKFIFKNEKPNIVVVVLEGWSSNAVSCLSKTQKSTPNFDKLASEGILFSNIFACGGTSEIGNSSIFSGYPALPEISISMHPEKHRKIHTINEELMGYSSNYLFSGDLKYENIGGYFMDHGFQHVYDEKIFPSNLKRGKLNYFDKDLYNLFLQKINNTKEPFLHCVFTGSTHSPYDHPKKKKAIFSGDEADFMNSMVYADECLGSFISKCKKEAWFKNTAFIFVADHGHPTPGLPNPSSKNFFRIPFLIWGAALKEEYCGTKQDIIGSQSDIAATLVYQVRGDLNKFPWSKDLLNPNSPEFALHTINRGYGWISNKGNYIYHMDTKTELENSYSKKDKKQEIKNCTAFLTQFYKNFKEL